MVAGVGVQQKGWQSQDILTLPPFHGLFNRCSVVSLKTVFIMLIIGNHFLAR